MSTTTNDPPAIAVYMAQFARALRALPPEDRQEIAAEIRSHLLLRAEAVGAEAAIAELGSAERCAQGFLDELRLQRAFADGSPGKSLATLAAVGARSVLGGAALLLGALLFAMALAFLALVPLELFAPASVGLWVNNDANGFSYGAISAESRMAGGRELLGQASIFVSLAFAALSYLLASWIARFSILLLWRRSQARLPRAAAAA
jgi:uncharacterized membrane protein